MTTDDLIDHARKKGTDKQFRQWVQTLPSCISGGYSEYLDSGDGRSIAAHVRRSSESGTGKKPEYCVVPLTFDQHNAQSWYGESACLNKYAPKGAGFWTVLDAKDWFDQQRIKYLKLWITS